MDPFSSRRTLRVDGGSGMARGKCSRHAQAFPQGRCWHEQRDMVDRRARFHDVACKCLALTNPAGTLTFQAVTEPDDLSENRLPQRECIRRCRPCTDLGVGGPARPLSSPHGECSWRVVDHIRYRARTGRDQQRYGQHNLHAGRACPLRISRPRHVGQWTAFDGRLWISAPRLGDVYEMQFSGDTLDLVGQNGWRLTLKRRE